MKKNIILLSTLVFSIFAYSQNSPRNIKDLRGWWKFDGNCIDSSGFKNNGTAFNCTYVLDRFNNKSKAIYLNGSNSVVKLDSTYFSGAVKQYLTFSFWVKLNNVPSSGYYTIFHKDGFWRLFAININLNDKTISTGGSYPSPQQYWGLTSRKGVIANDTNWHNWTITYDAGLINFYKDGIKDTSGSTFNSIDFSYLKAGNSNSVNYLGAANSVSNGDHQFLKGSLDDVAYWGRVLNPCEIASLVNINFKKKIVSIGANTQSYCGKDSVKITATTGFKSYAWSNGKTGSSIFVKSTGTYTIAATDSQGCTVYDTAVISVLNPKISPRDTVACNANNVSLSVKDVNFSGNCGSMDAGLKTGMTAWYPFCGNANDQVGTNNGTVSGGATLTAGELNVPNTAYSFNGSSSYIGLSQPFLGGGQVSEFTLRSKVLFNSLANNPNIWGKELFWGEINLEIWEGSLRLRWYNTVGGNTGSVIYTDTQKFKLKTNIWYDIVISFKNSKGIIYINGNSIATKHYWVAQSGTILSTTQVAASANFQQSSGSSRFGVRMTGGVWGNYLNGKIDEFNVWNRALSASEISRLYTQESTGSGKFNWSTSDTTATTKITKTGKSIVWVKVANGIGSCYDTTTVRIQKPIVSIGKDTQSFCGVDSAKLTATSGFASYNWSNGKKGASVYANATSPISVTATDSFGCNATDDALISVQNPRILPRDTIVCSGQAVNLKVRNTKGVNLLFNWSTGDIASITRIQTAGTTKVWLKQTNGIGTCYDTTTVRISNPVLNVAADTLRFTNCKRDSLRLSVGKKWKTVQWSHGPKDSAVFLKTTGKYSVRVQDSVGCFAADTFNFINPGKVIAQLLSTDSVRCFTESNGKAVVKGTGGFAPLTYLWNDGLSQKTTTAAGLKAGTYKVIITDAFGCKDSATAVIREPNKLAIQITAQDSPTCFGYSDGRITSIGTGGNPSYIWKWSGGQTTSAITGLAKGTYKVLLTDRKGCRDSSIVVLGEPAQVIPKIIAGQISMRDEFLSYTTSVTPTGTYVYSWQPAADFGDQANKPDGKIKLSKNTTLRLLVTSPNGCIGRDSLNITVIQPIANILPNAFSPNSDGLNEGFGLPDIFEIKDFVVYDRWGGIIFKGNSANPRWNGKVGNADATAGTYAYSITAVLKGTNQQVSYTGRVALIK